MKKLWVLLVLLVCCGAVGCVAMSTVPEKLGTKRTDEDLRVGVLRKMLQQSVGQTAIQKAPDSLITPLHEACLTGDCKMFDLLVRDKRYVNARDASGGTPLHYVAGCPWFVKPVATVSEVVKKKYEAACTIRRQMIFALRKAGADLNARDAFGATPYDYAKVGGHDALCVYFDLLSLLML